MYRGKNTRQEISAKFHILANEGRMEGWKEWGFKSLSTV